MSTKTHTEVVLRNLAIDLHWLADRISATRVDGCIPSRELPEFGNPQWVDGFIAGLNASARHIENNHLPTPRKKLRLVVSNE